MEKNKEVKNEIKTEIEVEAAQRAAEIVSRIEYGVCKKCGTDQYSQKCINELGGNCPECVQKLKEEEARLKQPVKESSDNRHKKPRGYKLFSDGKLAAAGN